MLMPADIMTKMKTYPISLKAYACARCGFITHQSTNHYGGTWSVGHFNCCPNCPPWAKYPEFGGLTKWICQESEPNEIL